MLRVKNLVKTVALSAVMFGAGATVATVALSYLPIVNATPTKVAQGLKQSKGEEVDEDNNLKFRFQDCKRGGKNVVCNVLATNLKNENQVVYFNDGKGKVRIIDVDGNQYLGKLIVNSQPQDDQFLSTNLIYGTPTKLSYSFEIPREVTKIAALEVNYTFPGYSKYSKVVFRDITIGASQQASNPTNPRDCTSPPQTNQKKPRPR